MDTDLRSIQEARELVARAKSAQAAFKHVSQERVDEIVSAMATAGAAAARRLAVMAHEETGFGRVDSKEAKNLFATETLHARMAGMRTCGVIRRIAGNTVWEVAVPMGVVAALTPSTNPTSTAMYKAIIAAKARCGIVISPHPRAAACTAEALNVVAEAAYRAGAPGGLFGCMTAVSISGTNELLESPGTDVILATGGTPMVRAAYSKGKPAYGVGSGNVPVYVDRSADVDKAASDMLTGVSFDWGTLCSTERSVVVDAPVRERLERALLAGGAYFARGREADMLRAFVVNNGKLNVDQVGMSPAWIARHAGFAVPEETRALIVEVDQVGPTEPLSMETLSPILTMYVSDGWERGCERCIEVLNYGGMGHTLGLHCTDQQVIEAFALRKPAMRIVVNTVAALGSVGYTTDLFPSMTLGPGAVGGSITSDNISPLHLLNVKRVAFGVRGAATSVTTTATEASERGSAPDWMDSVDERIRTMLDTLPGAPEGKAPSAGRTRDEGNGATTGLSESRIRSLIEQYAK